MLTGKKKRFIDEYLVDLNATKAAQRAGYSKDTAYSQGPRLLHDPEVAAALREAQEERAKRVSASADRIVAELMAVAHSNIMQVLDIQPDGSFVVDLSRLTPEQAAAISEVTAEEYVEGGGEDAKLVKRVKVKLWDKMGGIKQLREHMGLQGANQGAGVTVIINGDDANL